MARDSVDVAGGAVRERDARDLQTLLLESRPDSSETDRLSRPGPAQNTHRGSRSDVLHNFVCEFLLVQTLFDRLPRRRLKLRRLRLPDLETPARVYSLIDKLHPEDRGARRMRPLVDRPLYAKGASGEEPRQIAVPHSPHVLLERILGILGLSLIHI